MKLLFSHPLNILYREATAARTHLKSFCIRPRPSSNGSELQSVTLLHITLPTKLPFFLASDVLPFLRDNINDAANPRNMTLPWHARISSGWDEIRERKRKLRDGHLVEELGATEAKRQLRYIEEITTVNSYSSEHYFEYFVRPSLLQLH